MVRDAGTIEDRGPTPEEWRSLEHLCRCEQDLLLALQPLPRRIADYAVTGVIGWGGMGIVYEAIQPRPRRRVAVKVIRPERQSQRWLRRFEVETECLARLEHEGLARIYLADIDRSGDVGRPYFVMECIDGLPITEYAALRRLSLRARLGLLARVGDAVEHAHRQGIVHCDLKPSNILVTDGGVPKVLDFGAANMLAAERPDEHEADPPGTRAYMCPECRVKGATDARADVYALGVVGRELLAADGCPASRDVACILARATAPLAQRYESAAILAEELRRAARHEPVEARNGGVLYRAGRGLRRHRTLATVVGVCALVLVAMGASLHESRRRTNIASEVFDVVMTAVPDHDSLGGLIDVMFTGDRARADAREMLARRLLRNDNAAGAADELEQCLALREAVAPTDPATLRAANFLGDALVLAGRFEDARALARRWSGVVDDPEQRARFATNLGDALRRLERPAEALAAYEEARRLEEAALHDGHPDVPETLTSIALTLLDLRRPEEAAATAGRALELQQRYQGLGNQATQGALGALLYALIETGRIEEAEDLLAPMPPATSDGGGWTPELLCARASLRLVQRRFADAGADFERFEQWTARSGVTTSILEARRRFLDLRRRLAGNDV